MILKKSNDASAVPTDGQLTRRGGLILACKSVGAISTT